MFLQRFFFLILCLHQITSLHAQDLNVHSIHFEGNKRTQAEYLFQFVSTEAGVPIQLESLELDLRRFRNLEIIYDAYYVLDTVPEGIDIAYHVKETASRLPQIAFGGLRNNAWWMLGYTDINQGGQGNKYGVMLQQIDGQLGGALSYEKNQINGSRWGLGGRIERYTSVEPLYFPEGALDYQYLNYSVSSQLHYRVDPDRRLTFGASVFREKFEKSDPDISFGVDERTENKLLLGLHFRRQKIDPGVVYLSGNRLSFSAETVLQAGQEQPFYLLRFQAQRFLRLGKRGNLAARLSGGLSSNNDSPFAPFVIDSRINIRGAGNRIERGTAALVLNLEHRQSLLESKNLVIQAVGFVDTGSWRNPGGTIADLWKGRSLQVFAGLGLRFIYPHAGNAIFRVDYGKDLKGSKARGLVLGVGQFF